MFNTGRDLGDSYYSALAHAIEIAENGHALEFGVATGYTLSMIAEKFPVTGFDSFEGLPEDWREGFPKGMFAGPVPEVPNAEIVPGWFEDTLRPWLDKNPSRANNISLVHIDCDLYSSTKTVLWALRPYLRRGTIIVFDEYHGYVGWTKHEHKAWIEFVREYEINFEAVGYGPEQLVVRIL